MKRICILTHSHLCRNPRVVKEANALSQAGYEVTILTTWSDPALLEEDLTLIDTRQIKYIAGENIIPGVSSSWIRFKARLIRRIATELVFRFGFQTPHALGYGYGKNLRLALRQRADLYICHQELPTVIGCKLIRKGRQVAFDFEDWYSHDLLPEARRYRPVKLLEKVERFALRNSPLTYTTSESLSQALARFSGSAPPNVLYNVFPFEGRLHMDQAIKDRKDTSKVSMFWFSQTTGPGRGLEELIDALNQVKVPFELHLRGNCSSEYEKSLRKRFVARAGQDLFFHPLVSNWELLSRIGEHDIGLALEKDTPESRDLTITNKILQYLLGGLAVLASDTQGQREVAEKAYRSVSLFDPSDRSDLKVKLEQFMLSSEKLRSAKENALAYAQRLFCWEVESEKLVSWINHLMEDEKSTDRIP